MAGMATAQRPGHAVCAHRTPVRWLCAAAAGAVFALIGTAARADAVTDWNVTAFDVLKAANIGGNPQIRALAIVHVAMSDAVNRVQNRYTRHALDIALTLSASAEAAAPATVAACWPRLRPPCRAGRACR